VAAFAARFEKQAAGPDPAPILPPTTDTRKAAQAVTILLGVFRDALFPDSFWRDWSFGRFKS
jgi:hypothetical protein